MEVFGGSLDENRLKEVKIQKTGSPVTGSRRRNREAAFCLRRYWDLGGPPDG